MFLSGHDENIQDVNDDTDCCGHDHDRYGADMNGPAVLAFVIIDETR